MTKLNNSITNCAKMVTDSQNLATAKEKKYIKDQEAANRKSELNLKIIEYSKEEKKLLEKIVPLQSQITSKQGEKDRL